MSDRSTGAALDNLLSVKMCCMCVAPLSMGYAACVRAWLGRDLRERKCSFSEEEKAPPRRKRGGAMLRILRVESMLY